MKGGALEVKGGLLKEGGVRGAALEGIRFKGGVKGGALEGGFVVGCQGRPLESASDCSEGSSRLKHM